jgi:hypothetical protein
MSEHRSKIIPVMVRSYLDGEQAMSFPVDGTNHMKDELL